MPRFANWGIRLWRLAALITAAYMLHLSANRAALDHASAPFGLREARQFFPEAARVVHADVAKHIYTVLDRDDRELGTLLTTSPDSDFVIGYVGPNNVLVALDRKGKVAGAQLLSSGDTRAHVAEVESSANFWKQFIGWSPSESAMPKPAAVAGSTLTSLGVAEAMQNRLSGRTESLRFPEPLNLAEIQQLFPAAERFTAEANRAGWHRVFDKTGKHLGFAVRTSPASDYNRGHSGPAESLVGVQSDEQTIIGVRIRRSYDTEDYVDSVRSDVGYLGQLTNFTVEEWSRMDLKQSGLEGVSGATETSFAVAEGLRRRFATPPTAEPGWAKKITVRDVMLGGIVLGALVISFSGWRGKRWVRVTWQVILIGVFGLWMGDLLSLALLAGWARQGLTSEFTPGILLLGAVALLVPWAFQRQIYCNELCPHGAAQEWLGKFKRLHVALSPKLRDRLRFLPGILLIVAVLVGLLMPAFDLANIEPFDAWSLKGTIAATTAIAIAGLIASAFVPMAYCRFGCPTGALLRFLRTAGDSNRFGLRDACALGLLSIGALFLFAPLPKGTSSKAQDVALGGNAFGTTWTVTLRTPVANITALEEKLQSELDRIQNSLSSWSSNSPTARFNRAKTTYPVEMPAELLALVSKAQELSRMSDGAFDITVGPLVRRWGFGPGDVPSTKPSSDELDELRGVVGWQKLTVNTDDFTLRKSHPQLQIDLGALLQGYAADRIAVLLNESGSTEYLIEVGGELLARGSWHVAIEDPSEPSKIIRSLHLRDAALATSGTYRAKRSDNQSGWSHIIDPKTGAPVEHDAKLVSIIHRSCADADALATTLLVLGPERAEQMAKSNGWPALIVTERTNTAVSSPE